MIWIFIVVELLSLYGAIDMYSEDDNILNVFIYFVSFSIFYWIVILFIYAMYKSILYVFI